MKIIVYPHAMEIGGPELHAVPLAGAVRGGGHEVSGVAGRGARVRDPRVDADQDRPGVGGADFRARYAPDPALPLAVMVCRLVPVLKRESLLSACTAIGSLADAGTPVQLVIVGDGPIRDEL